MKEIYFERPQQPICKQDEIQWQEPRQLEDEMGAIRFCWPLASEGQMWEQARCRECNQPAHWVAIGSPFNDGEQYFMGCDSWCYWCFPRRHFTEEELRLVRHAEWAREQTTDEIIQLIREANLFTDDNTVESALSNVADEISERMETRGGELEKRAKWGAALQPAVKG
ncbi:MAG: hypothetical protein WCF89_19870 [Candidatus Sulfotelmatobacter sp.]|jgi:hypothetical protein